MNEQELEKEIRAARARIVFDPERKAALRGHLARIIEASVSIREQRHGRQGQTSQMFFRKLMPLFAGVTVLVLIGGSTSFAAEGALPGDILYPVKVGLNEKVRAIVAFTPEAKADWNTSRVERRLEEAEKLTARGAVSEDTNAKIAAQFDESAERVEAGIAEIEASGNVRKAADIASRLETSIRTHKKILARLSVGGNAGADVSAAAATTGVAGSVRSEIEAVPMATPPLLRPEADTIAAPENRLETKVRLRASAATKIREKLEVKIESEHGDRSENPGAETSVEASASGKIGAAERSIEAVRNYIGQRRSELGDAAVTTAVLRLGAAADLIVQAKTHLAAGSFGEAFNLGSQATRIAQEARLLVGAHAEFKVNFGEDGDKDGSSLRDEFKGGSSSEKSDGDGRDEEGQSDDPETPRL